MKSFTLLVFAFLIVGVAQAADISGIPTIVDGDTVVIGGKDIRLLDLDAPESDQFCIDRNGEPWNCGIDARDALTKKLGARNWICVPNGKKTYKRILASCTADGENVSRWMIQEGLALSFDKYGYRYKADEREAMAAHKGLWSGAFIAPWEWRRRNCKTEIRGAESVPIDSRQKLCGSPSTPPDPNCTIKATMRRGECIYHMEGDHYYGAIKMPGRQKRWFCSEDDAKAANCRKSAR